MEKILPFRFPYDRKNLLWARGDARRQGEGGWLKNRKMWAMSFMDDPLCTTYASFRISMSRSKYKS